jgi:hypothetical protein
MRAQEESVCLMEPHTSNLSLVVTSHEQTRPVVA